MEDVIKELLWEYIFNNKDKEKINTVQREESAV